MQKFSVKKIKIPSEDRTFNMDPTGIAPVSPSDNNGMLHTYTTGPGPRAYGKTEKALLQGLFLRHSVFVRSVTNISLYGTIIRLGCLFVKWKSVDNQNPATSLYQDYNIKKSVFQLILKK